MIKGLMGKGSVQVNAGNTSVPYINQNINNPMQGMIRINGSEVQAFDSDGWVVMGSSYATVNLTPEIESLLDWARKKRDEEMAWEVLATDNQAVKIALDNLEQAQRQLAITATLARDYETNN